MANSAIPKNRAALNADYVIGTLNSGLPNAQPLGGLGTGFLFSTDDGTTGTVSVVGDPDVTPVTETIEQANSFDVMDVVRRDGTAGEYILAQADSATNGEAIGMVVAASTTHFTLQQSGFVPASRGFFGFVDGEVSFLDPANAGGLTTTDPTTTGDISKPMFIATDTDEGWILPYRGMIVGGGSAGGAGGEWNLISDNDLSADTSLTLNTIFSDNPLYGEFYIKFVDMYSTANDTVLINYIIATVVQSSNYTSETLSISAGVSGSSVTAIETGAGTDGQLGTSLASASQGELYVYAPNSNGTQKMSGGNFYYGKAAARVTSTIESSARFHNSLSPLDGFRVTGKLGGSLTGKVKVYGRK